IGTGVVPAPSLPDPGYLANSVGAYPTAQGYNQNNRGTWTEMNPGHYGSFHLSGGSASCAFLTPGVNNWTGNYTSDATGSLLSNELKSPDEAAYDDPTYQALANPQFWNMNAAGCAGHFTLATAPAPAFGIKHQGGGGNWGVELTSIRYDRFLDGSISPDPCLPSPGCIRESAPSVCQAISTLDANNLGIVVAITQNAPGAEYYGVYVNPNGCDGVQTNFGFYNRTLAPGFTDGGGPPASASGPFPSGAPLPLSNGLLGFTCPVPGVTICNIAYNNMSPTMNCFSQVHQKLCDPPDTEIQPQCFSSCRPPAGLLSQENAPMSLEYPPYTGGDIANEDYCQPPPNPGDPNAPCQGSQITP